MKPVLVLALAAAASVAACSDVRREPGTLGTVHDPGITDPTSDNFHGKVLAAQGWDLSVCMTCHDPSKPGAAPACQQCHADGPTGCTSCHALPPPSGAHLAHAKANDPESCKTCHPVPTDWKDPGHLGPQAVFAFAAIAGAGATFDGTRCDNVYCHGATLHDPAATNNAPAWNGGPAEAACGTCHGKPPANHGGGYDCATCHPKDAPHVDGTVQVNGVAGACDGCHGSAQSPAPPRDLAGNLFTTALGVGAHQAHLNGPHRLRGPIACTECHQVPTKVDDPGHIDTPPPAEVTSELGWDRTSATCAVWCHQDARPVWTQTGQVFCGSCHGVPPADNMHLPGTKLTDCVTCHPSSVDAAGFPIVTDGPNGPTSEHINGRIDF
jgi:predicted CxxxxCH...CXXCH cytochrome family protein